VIGEGRKAKKISATFSGAYLLLVTLLADGMIAKIQTAIHLIKLKVRHRNRLCHKSCSVFLAKGNAHLL